MRHLKEFNTGERSIERVSELQAVNFGQVFPSLNILIIRSRKPPLSEPLDGVGVIPCKKDVPYFFSPGVRLLCKRSHWAELPPYHSLSGKRLKNALYFSLNFFHDKNKSGPKFRCNSFFFIFNKIAKL